MIHAITATWAFDEAKRRDALPRRCPKCRCSQRAPEESINEPVYCGECGTEIPQKTTTNRQKKENEQISD